MKNRNTEFKTILVVLGLAVVPIVQAAPRPDSGPTASCASANAISANSAANSADLTSSESPFPLLSIYSVGNVIRGETGSFVLSMDTPHVASGCYVNFSVGGTAVSGVDYLALIFPAYVGASGYGVISVKTLPVPTAAFIRQAYSVTVTLEPGLGYALGEPRSAQMWIKTR
jgi:hypothetical protein